MLLRLFTTTETVVEVSTHGTERLDAAVARLYGMPRRTAASFVRDGLVKVDGNLVRNPRPSTIWLQSSSSNYSNPLNYLFYFFRRKVGSLV